MIGKAAESVENAIQGASDWRRKELAGLVDICRHLQCGPPRSFHEALQLLWFVNMGVEYGDNAALVCPGRLDRILRPFYDADLASGVLKRERALLLIETFLMRGGFETQVNVVDREGCTEFFLSLHQAGGRLGGGSVGGGCRVGWAGRGTDQE